MLIIVTISFENLVFPEVWMWFLSETEESRYSSISLYVSRFEGELSHRKYTGNIYIFILLVQ